ncbi:hypothetical protein GmHk_09G025378 [Glycine max]|nr:hypothetical protein GmHk_09G025378 [Glycine max]
MNNTLLFSVKEESLETRKLRKFLAKEEEEDIKRRNLKSLKLLTVRQRRKFIRLWASGNGHLQPKRMVWTTLSVKNMTSARINGPSFVRPPEIPRCAEKSTGHPKAKHRPPQLKLMVEKTKKKLEEAAQSGSTEGVINPPSPTRRHVKWKMACTKKTRQMTSEAAKDIVEKFDSLEEQASQGSFVPHGHQEVLTAAIGQLEHPGHVCPARAGVTIKQYFVAHQCGCG